MKKQSQSKDKSIGHVMDFDLCNKTSMVSCDIEKRQTSQLKPFVEVLPIFNKNKKYGGIISRTQYKDFYGQSFITSRAVMSLVINFFNCALEDKRIQLKHKFNIICHVCDKNVMPKVSKILSSPDSVNNTLIIELDGMLFGFNMLFYIEGREYRYVINITSHDKHNIDMSSLYLYFLNAVILHSNVKGSKIFLNESLSWAPINMPKRGFDDIYLPNSQMKEITSVYKIFKENGIILRSLFLGSPGTGKTESVIVMANELNKLGVTVIKTQITGALWDTIKFAELVAPSLILLDDIDLSLGARDSGSGVSPNLQGLLDVLDGTEKIPDNVGIIATTNSAHLLDIAVQRPGRFNKIVVFDEITKDNIKNIIKKSLRNEFGINEVKHASIFKSFTDQRIIDLYSDSSVTGAFVYDSVRVNYLSIKSNKNVCCNIVDEIIEGINNEISCVKKIDGVNFLKRKLNNRNNNGIGFHEEKLDYELRKENEYISPGIIYQPNDSPCKIGR